MVRYIYLGERRNGELISMDGFFDGASRGNPGIAGAGALIVNEAGEVVWEDSKFLGTKTNNEAEYEALIMLLRAARERKITKMEIFGDSKLVVSQVSKIWKIKLPHLRVLAETAWEAMEGMEVKLTWIPREMNAKADRLSNDAIDAIR